MEKLNILFYAEILERALHDKASRTGIFFVAQNVVKHFLEDARVELYVYCRAGIRQALNDYFRREFGRNMADRMRVEGDDLGDMHVFLSPCNIVPSYVRRFPSVICFTVLHDIIPLLFPKYFSAGCDGWFADLVKSINKDDFYFAVSQYTKNDFARYVPDIDPEKITVTHLAADKRFFPDHDPARLQAVRQKYGIPEGARFLFSLCTLEPRKNLIRAVSAFIAFIKKNHVDDMVYVLGGTAWDAFMGRIEKEVPDFRQYANRIIRTGYLPDDELSTLLSNAEWFVYTSQYEGFGMPPLEAMQCGCPVIVSNNSSLPEVTGDAGLCVDYESLEQHIEAYEKYYFNPRLREENAAKGIERARRFTWKKCTDTMIETMMAIAQRKREQPLVSVITVTRNALTEQRGAQLAQCLESVHMQTYRHVEHIVIDCSSADGTFGLLKSYEERGWIRLFSEPDMSLYEALNKGIACARGTYVNFLDSLDFFHDSRGIELSVAQILSLRADYSYGDTLLPVENEAETDTWRGDIRKLSMNMHFCTGTMFVHAGVLKQLGGFDTSYAIAADSDLVMRICEAGYRHTHVKCSFLTSRSYGLAERHSEEARVEHSTAFFRHVGSRIGFTPFDAYVLWQGRLFAELSVARQISLIGMIPPEYGSECLMQQLTENLTTGGKNMFYNSRSQLYLLSFIPVMRRKGSSNKVTYDLFSFLRLLKIVKYNNKRKYYLFGFIPVWKVKTVVR